MVAEAVWSAEIDGAPGYTMKMRLSWDEALRIARATIKAMPTRPDDGERAARNSGLIEAALECERQAKEMTFSATVPEPEQERARGVATTMAAMIQMLVSRDDLGIWHGFERLASLTRPAGGEEVAVTDDMLNVGQERLCQIRSSTNFDDEAQAEIFKAMYAALTKPATLPTPRAYLKTWNRGGDIGGGVRVDLHAECEPWLAARNPTITPLYEHPPQPAALPKEGKEAYQVTALMGGTRAKLVVSGGLDPYTTTDRAHAENVLAQVAALTPAYREARIETVALSSLPVSGEVDGEFVAGPCWQNDDPDEEYWTAEIQIVGGHDQAAVIHAATEEEACRRRDVVLHALNEATRAAGRPQPQEGE